MTTVEIPSRQEMFNRAWNGLKGQGWKTSTFKDGRGCSYDGPDGRKCAWGWVDPEGTKDDPTKGDPTKGVTYNPRWTKTGQLSGTVLTLRIEGIGLAALIPNEDEGFIAQLQSVHDGAREGHEADLVNEDPATKWYMASSMEQRMRLFAREYGLSIPE